MKLVVLNITVWVECTAATRSKQIQQLSSNLILGRLEIKYKKKLSLGESSKKGVTNVNPASAPPPLFDEKKPPKMHFYRIHFEVLLAILVFLLPPKMAKYLENLQNSSNFDQKQSKRTKIGAPHFLYLKTSVS